MAEVPVAPQAALAVLRASDRRWALALKAGERFAARLQEVAEAAEERGKALALVHAAGVPWMPEPGASKMRSLADEFGPQSPRPGPPHLWRRFDDSVAGLGAALEGDSVIRVAGAFEVLAAAAGDIVQALGEAEPIPEGRSAAG